jgi:hypothetical protein
MVAEVNLYFCVFEDFPRVVDQVKEALTHRVVCICPNPAVMGWQTHSDSTVDECLNGGSRSCKLIW